MLAQKFLNSDNYSFLQQLAGISFVPKDWLPRCALPTRQSHSLFSINPANC